MAYFFRWFLWPFAWLRYLGWLVKNWCWKHGCKIVEEMPMVVIRLGYGTTHVPDCSELISELLSFFLSQDVSCGLLFHSKPSWSHKFEQVPVEIHSDAHDGLKKFGQKNVDLVIVVAPFEDQSFDRDLDLFLWDTALADQQIHLAPVGDLREPVVALSRSHGLVMLSRGSDCNSELFFEGKPRFYYHEKKGFKDSELFYDFLRQTLRPHFVVASNGYGEDSMGVRLAQKLALTFPQAKVSGFSLVGKGESYEQGGFVNLAPPAETPSGGVIRKGFLSLWNDLRHGLLTHVLRQNRAWNQLRGQIRTVLAVGDAFLAAQICYGQGRKPIVIATAKSCYLNGHLAIEKKFYGSRAKAVWTRDQKTCEDLLHSGVRAFFSGSPIMDLAQGVDKVDLWTQGRKILFLPGSRERTYQDIKLAVSVLQKVAQVEPLSLVMNIASSIDVEKLAQSCDGRIEGEHLYCGALDFALFKGPVAAVASGAELLFGWGGTANQVCAGMGVPVIAPDEPGKRSQKKLLGDAELLVKPDVELMASAIIDLLHDEKRRAAMSQAGQQRLGGWGVADQVCEYAAEHLGWRRRCHVCSQIR